MKVSVEKLREFLNLLYNNEIDKNLLDFNGVLHEMEYCLKKIENFSQIKNNFSIQNFGLNYKERFCSLICRSYPPTLQVEVTNKCNLRCVHCGVITKGVNTLPLYIFDKLKKIFPYLNSLTWLGGEVFLVDYFYDLIKQINTDFPHIEHVIYTNGLSLDETKIDLISDIEPLTIKFSIDSVVKDTYEKLRLQGNFEKSNNNLRMLIETYKRKNKIPKLAINVVVMKSNIEELLLYPDFCKKYSIGYLDVSFLSDIKECSNPENFFSEISFEKIKKIKKIIEELEIKCKEYNIQLFCNFYDMVDLIKEPNVIFTDVVKKRRFETYGIVRKNVINTEKYVYQCAWPWHSMYIKCTGFVVPTGDCLVPAGNILYQDIEEIWNGEIMQIYRYKMMMHDLDNWCNYHCIRKSNVNKKLIEI
ncbi:MAG: radical SAM protein [Candidatus Micrarchaeia archaeon]